MVMVENWTCNFSIVNCKGSFPVSPSPEYREKYTTPPPPPSKKQLH